MAKNKSSATILAYKECFSTSAGQKVLRDLARTHNMMSSSFRETKDGSLDPLQMCRAEGERNVVLRIFNVLQVPFKELEKMMKEESDE